MRNMNPHHSTAEQIITYFISTTMRSKTLMLIRPLILLNSLAKQPIFVIICLNRGFLSWVPFGHVANALVRQTLTSGVKHVLTAAMNNATCAHKSEPGNGFSVSKFIDTLQALASLVIARLRTALGAYASNGGSGYSQ
jgi:hypothetical protein